ncbi:hypothetical protein RchiOBHm_Chr7g0232411 [Rosa chinensis]|uniref:Uncharacterized protein n=1 Tax=Rosa chinensis TaxID=74649 RepID=A0A2P6PFX6_ROSCH|nr:hypothetical protein RchiOBHm_Chr7g0232411 [Rosa chinensis]
MEVEDGSFSFSPTLWNDPPGLERVVEIFKGGGGAYGSSLILGICHQMLKCQVEDRG